MTSTWDILVRHLATRIGAAAGESIDPSECVAPPKPEMGDIAFGCFRLAKKHAKSPAEIATSLAETLQKTADESIARVHAEGPYLNIHWNVATLVPRLIRDVIEQGDSFGASDARKEDRILFEYANPNTHKEIHVGHLRNFILGASMVRILRRGGATVIPVSYINDVGTHVAKCLWRLVTRQGFVVKTFDEAALDALIAAIPETDRNAKFLGNIYSEATSALEEQENAKEQISFVMTALEAHSPVWQKLWTETRRWSMDELTDIFSDLGVHIERQYFDSECVDAAHALLPELEAKGIAAVSQGALGINMDDQKLGMMLLRKTDGSLLYAAKDIALAKLKAHEYPTVTQSVVLVDERQSLAFRQLGEALRRMNYPIAYGYLGYELVTLPEGAMSSRKGNIVTFQSFRDAVLAAARESTEVRHGGDWNIGKVTHTAWCLAMAGIKYSVLRQDPEKLIVFDIQKSLSFDGDTGAYVLYAATRLASIIKKTGWTKGLNEHIGFETLKEDSERRLAVRIAQFVDMVRRAAKETKPSVVAQWCFGIAQDINAFYRDVPVNDAPLEVKNARIQLVLLAHHALLQGLDLLGIPVPEEM